MWVEIKQEQFDVTTPSSGVTSLCFRADLSFNMRRVCVKVCVCVCVSVRFLYPAAESHVTRHAAFTVSD